MADATVEEERVVGFGRALRDGLAGGREQTELPLPITKASKV